MALAGGNTNNTYSGPTVIGDGTADTTALQIGNGGTSGAIDPSSPIYLSGYAELDFPTVATQLRCPIFFGVRQAKQCK